MRKILLCMLAGLVLLSCSKKEVKPVTQEARATGEAFALVETIKSAFMKNDTNLLLANTTDEGYKAVTARKKSFEAIELDFTPRWVDMDGDRILVNISWKSSWITSGKRAEDRGMAVFVMEGRPLKVSRILRANPFAYPEQP